MTIQILKYGGTSIGTIQRINTLKTKLINTKHKLLIIVSAVSGYTDRCIKLYKKINNTINTQEAAAIITTGEQITAALLTTVIKPYRPTCFKTAWQIPIITHLHNNANQIKYINRNTLKNLLIHKQIIIICGFQGINLKNYLTTLDRGGSDTTAIAIAIAMNTNKCFLFKDVKGIYALDPNKFKVSIKYNKINYKQLLELASVGSRILNINSIYIALKHKIKIILKYSFSKHTKTINTIVSKTKTMVKLIHSRTELLITIKTQNPYKILKLINKHNIPVHFYTLTNKQIEYTTIKDNYMLLAPYLHKSHKTQKIACISVIGIGIHSCKKYTYKICATITQHKLPILKINITETKLTIITKRTHERTIITMIRKITKI